VDAAGRIFIGELVVNQDVADGVVDIFRQLYRAGYPIEKMHLIDDYDASDDASTEDDNTSAFNFRVVAGTNSLSNHAMGHAIDINPFYNPSAIPSENYVSPADAYQYADRSVITPYTIQQGDLCYRLFEEHGWVWGGEIWENARDYQHFEYER